MPVVRPISQLFGSSFGQLGSTSNTGTGTLLGPLPDFCAESCERRPAAAQSTAIAEATIAYLPVNAMGILISESRPESRWKSGHRHAQPQTSSLCAVIPGTLT